MVKNPLANARDVRDGGLIPGSGRSPGGGHAIHSSILAWRIPWKEEPGRLQSTGLDMTELLHFHFHWSRIESLESLRII